MGKIKAFIKDKQKKVEVAILTISLLLCQTTLAFAAIDGNSIKNNLIDNIIFPIYIVIFLVILIKDFLKKNIASAAITLVIGGLIGIFVYSPDTLKAVIDFIRGLVGL